MRTFKGTAREAGMEAVMRDMALHAGAEPREMEALCALLRKMGVRHSHDGAGPFQGMSFQCPHGEVLVAWGPGSIGYPGLLQAYCEGWDLSPRGNLTARQVWLEYMTGGWE